MLHRAIDGGVNYVDTAWMYHENTSETWVGEALKGGYREKVKLATKLPAWLVRSRADQVRQLPDGAIYYVIMRGKAAMPSYAADLSQDERWSVVTYVRALQRALNAPDSDMPKETPK